MQGFWGGGVKPAEANVELIIATPVKKTYADTCEPSGKALGDAATSGEGDHLGGSLLLSLLMLTLVRSFTFRVKGELLEIENGRGS